MSDADLSRRELIKKSGQVAAASVLAGMAVPQVHAAGDETIRVALVGCGGRGTGAAINALATKKGPTKLVAMADVFEDKMANSAKILSSRKEQFDVPKERQFIGFDAYQKAMDCLRAGDVVIMATPPAFRWVHFTYAIKKGIHTFMEKPVTVDGPSTRKMFELGKLSEKQNLKVGVGLMCRHCVVRQELFDRIRKGQIGDVLLLRAYRMQGPIGSAFSGPKPSNMTELLYQIRRFHSFLWASGGCYSDFLIHNIDECCWMKNAWPVEAKGSGGRHYRGKNIDQNFDHYSVEYTFADGTKFYLEGRNIHGCHNEFASYVHGSKGSAVISRSGHTPTRARIYKGQRFTTADAIWKAPRNEPNPYQLEWEHLMDAIRNNKPHNEVERGAEASLITAMGRMACHTGQTVTRDDILNSKHEFAPQVDRLTMKGPAPLVLGDNSTYPVPQPGIKVGREY